MFNICYIRHGMYYSLVASLLFFTLSAGYAEIVMDGSVGLEGALQGPELHHYT